MDNLLFIPKKLKVGFKKRSDTVDDKLAYVIYYDEKGKIRKEKSFESWRDKNIPTIEVDNEPIEGFTLNKGVKRIGGYFSSGRNMIRVYDPRGIEFEINIDNLMYILMQGDCTRRELHGKFVYGWHKSDLILIPTSSEDYINCVEYSQRRTKRVSKKDIVVGGVYYDNKNEKVVYLGDIDSYEKKPSYAPIEIYQMVRYHKFYNITTGKYFTTADFSFLRVKIDIQVNDLDVLMTSNIKNHITEKIIGVSFDELTPDYIFNYIDGDGYSVPFLLVEKSATNKPKLTVDNNTLNINIFHQLLFVKYGGWPIEIKFSDNTILRNINIWHSHYQSYYNDLVSRGVFSEIIINNDGEVSIGGMSLHDGSTYSLYNPNLPRPPIFATKFSRDIYDSKSKLSTEEREEWLKSISLNKNGEYITIKDIIDKYYVVNFLTNNDQHISYKNLIATKFRN